MIHRWTLWEEPLQAGELQMSLALLDDDWEPLYEQTLPCGPFHGVEERRLELLDNARRWLRQYGVQQRLAGL